MPGCTLAQRRRGALAQTHAAAATAEAASPRPAAAAASRAPGQGPRRRPLGLLRTLPTTRSRFPFPSTNAPTAGAGTRGCCPAAPAAWPGARGLPPPRRGRPRGRPACASTTRRTLAHPRSAAVATVNRPPPPKVLLEGLPARQLAHAQAHLCRVCPPEEPRPCVMLHQSRPIGRGPSSTTLSRGRLIPPARWQQKDRRRGQRPLLDHVVDGYSGFCLTAHVPSRRVHTPPVVSKAFCWASQRAREKKARERSTRALLVGARAPRLGQPRAGDRRSSPACRMQCACACACACACVRACACVCVCVRARVRASVVRVCTRTRADRLQFQINYTHYTYRTAPCLSIAIWITVHSAQLHTKVCQA
jgi:hypothetical protein